MKDAQEQNDLVDLSPLYKRMEALIVASRELYAAIKNGLGDDEFIAMRKAFVQDAEGTVRILYLLMENLEHVSESVQNAIDLCDSIAIAEWSHRDNPVEYWECNIPFHHGGAWRPERAIHRKIIGREDAAA